MLPGAIDGLAFYLRPDFTKLLNAEVWINVTFYQLTCFDLKDTQTDNIFYILIKLRQTHCFSIDDLILKKVFNQINLC